MECIQLPAQLQLYRYNNQMKKFLIIISFFAVLATPVIAQEATSNEFNIRVFGSNDTIPPTTPVLAATSTTATQVDLSWSTSTDNFAVSGYRLYRGAVVIATTTQLSFIDSGLSPSTTYSYQVQAFDTAFNFSTTSNLVTVTTPDLPVEPVQPVVPLPEANSARVAMRMLDLNTGVSTSSIGVETAFPSRIELRWGRTETYELGYFVGGVYRSDHSFFLDDLEPGTTYAYEIVGFTPRGQERVLVQDTFTTKSLSEIIPIPNVSNFWALQNEQDVDLSWSLPRGIDTQFVRIVRSHLGFPEYPNNGAVVYQGLSTEFVDENILSVYSPVYYTAFLYDTSESVSSGALAVVYAANDGEPDGEAGMDIGLDVDVFSAPTSTINTDRVSPDMLMPGLRDIIVSQDELKYTMEDSPLFLDSLKSVKISIAKESITGNLKSIIATIINPTDNRDNFSFLLRINPDRTAYEAVIASLGVTGRSQLKLGVYDFESFMVASYQSPIMFTEPEARVDETLADVVFNQINLILLGVILAATSFLIFLLVKRQRDEDNQ